MDREWMYKRLDKKLLSSIYVEKVGKFVEFACSQEGVYIDGKLKCPCSKCENVPYQEPDTIKLHLCKYGFTANYYQWTCHGEDYVENVPLTHGCSLSVIESNPYMDMVIDAFRPTLNYENVEEGSHNDEEEPLPEAKNFLDMLKAAEKPLYKGCNISLLAMAARVLNIQCDYNIPHKAINAFASLVKDICPEDNKMTESFRSTEKLLHGLELPHQKIHVCPNGCMLFWKEDTSLNECKICHTSRYGNNSNPIKVLTYFPITPRLQRLYATESNAQQMRWHAENRRPPGLMSHPSDAEEWKHFDITYPSFAVEPRNVRLGLCTDGFAPFGKSGQQYSCWPVILTPYNLPPWLCMKRSYMFLTLIIPGPKAPKGNLDIYLQPLIEELQNLWEHGVPTYDISKKQNFQMKVALLWTISDFPAYGMLSGWSTAGKLACPLCMENTKSFYLQNGMKCSWFDCHRQFLPSNHVFRHNKSGFFKDRVENSLPPPRLSGDQVWECVSKLPKSVDRTSYGKLPGFGVEHNWTKQSIFWELPYWKKLLLRHNLDLMHIEKNVFDNLFHTIMDVKGRTKDNINARKDLKLYCKRRKLEVQNVVFSDGTVKMTVPSASYVLTKEKRKVLCEWIQELKFPDGYASKLGRCVDTKEYRLFGLKSHDCHIFLQRLFPVAFRELLPKDVWSVLTELSQFFRDLSSTTLREDHLVCLEKNIPEIICKLEKIFPPSFFNSMEHLPVHLPYEAKLGGPVQYRWMYPFERFLYHLKKKVGNKARVEGSICNAYIREEISNFCAHYFEHHIDSKMRNSGISSNRVDNECLEPDVPEPFSFIGGYNPLEGMSSYLDDKELRKAHTYILSNCGILSLYEGLFVEEMMRTHNSLSENDVWAKYEDNFSLWFNKYVTEKPNFEDDIINTLALGPSTSVQKFSRYYVNGFHFHTYDYGKKKSTMNYGVCVKSDQGKDYHGILKEVIELEYVGAKRCYKTVLFKCDWFDTEQGTRIHEKYQLVEINSTRRYPKYDPFVLAYQVEQVYFTPYPSLTNEKRQWWVVFKSKGKGTTEAAIDQMAFQENAIDHLPSLSEVEPEELPLNIHDNAVIVSGESGNEDEILTETDSDEEELQLVVDDYATDNDDPS